MERPAQSRSDPPAERHPLLRRGDQLTVAGLLVLAGVLMLIHLGFVYRVEGPAVELDQFPLEPIELQIDINQADWPELTLLPGIGETLAKRIVAFRDRHGRFESPDDLQRVRGIGPKTVAKARRMIVIGRLGKPSND